jgi:hypothetical chaperone protein
VAAGEAIELATLESGNKILPSAMFLDNEVKEVFFGQEAIELYRDGNNGRLMRALKSILSTDLIEESTVALGKRISFREIVRQFIVAMKNRAEAFCGRDLTSVVHGRPVRFVDNDEDGDRRAENVLRSVCEAAGFREVSFQFEPICAAYAFERDLSDERIAIVCDIGGGTSDFSVVRLGPDRASKSDRTKDVLSNEGVRVGGTDFDRAISLRKTMPLFGLGQYFGEKHLPMPKSPYLDLATWSTVNFAYTRENQQIFQEILLKSDGMREIERMLAVLKRRLGHRCIDVVEQSKIELSGKEEATIRLGFIEDDLSVPIMRSQMAAMIEDSLLKIEDRIVACVANAGLRAQDIDIIVLTGGSSLVPSVRDRIVQSLPDAEIASIDSFGAVGIGLGIEAHRRYGAA